MTIYGYHGKILHIDLTTRTATVEEPSEKFYRLYAGGGLLGTYYLFKETRAGIDAFSPENRLIFTSSVVAGHPAAGLPRFTVCAKSPLTNGIGETRCEGPWGVALKACGYDALVISGAADAPVSLLIDHGTVHVIAADGLWGKTVGETCDALEADYGTHAQIAAIGPAGERRVRFASIVSARTFQAARMGMGAVMGSKQLKAIILLDGEHPALAHPAKVAALTADFTARMPDNPLSMWQKNPPGFAVWIYTHGIDAALDVENYRRADFPDVAAYKEEHFMPHVQGHVACPGCPNDCIKVLHSGDADLDPRASGIHQEVTGAMGINLGLDDIRAVLRANNLCNQWGMDPTSLGFTLSYAMELVERGLMTAEQAEGLRFGDAQAVLAMMRKIAYREAGIADVLAEGSKRAAAHLGGAEYALHVKGLEMVPFEPRSQTNLALGFAVASIGPRYDICEHDWDYDTEVGWDHTLKFSNTVGILERIPMNYLGARKVKNFKALHTLWSAADALDLCIFAVAPTRLLSLTQMAEMVSAVTGWETSAYEVMRWGERRIHLMRIYNNREGLTSDDDRLPARFYDEPIREGVKAGDQLDRAAFAQAVQLYYAMMGWDAQGVPTVGTLYDFELEWTLGD